MKPIELRFKADAKLVERLMERRNANNASDIARDALAFYDWATQELSEGRHIQSVVDLDPTVPRVPIVIVGTTEEGE